MKVYGVIGWKNSGKTSLMERLVADITARGLTVSTVKHVHHDVDLDQPGKDSHRHRAAGASEVVLASAHRFAILREHRGPEPELPEVLARMAPVDLVLVEGYKRDAHAKIEVFRREAGHDLIQPHDPLVRAVATDADLGALPVPMLDLNDTVAIADFILQEVGLQTRHAPPAPGAFDTVIIVDWSARAALSPAKPSKDAIWIGVHDTKGGTEHYCRSRAQAEAKLTAILDAQAALGHRVLCGFDFPMGYPTGFAERLTGSDTARAVWKWLAAHITDDARNMTNRLAVGGQINARFHPLAGPFWGRPQGQNVACLPFTKAIEYTSLNLSERRAVERLLPSASPVWQLMGAGSVGSQALTGLPMVHRIAQRPGCKVWPFDDTESALVLAEVYPSIITSAVAQGIAATAEPKAQIADQWQVRLLAQALFRLSASGDLTALFDTPAIAQEEGWILGAGHQAALLAAL